MPGFAGAYASVTARYGSVDTHLPDGRALPVGVAHFLEHQMFQSPAGDVFDQFAARGASANAYTTFTHTTYLFSCTSQFEANLQTLLDAVGSLETTPASVEREKGIIGQEIAMYVDDPDWRAYFNLLAALYRRHPCRHDIAGTDASIAPIDRALLQDLHAAFYAPANLVVTAAGDIDADDVFRRTQDTLTAPGRRLRRPRVAEPRSVRRTTTRGNAAIQRSQVVLGLKDTPAGGGQALLRRRLTTRLVLDALFGDGGRIQAPLHEAGWADDSFGASYEAGPDAAFAAVGGETDDVRGFQRALGAALRQAANDGFTDAEVQRTRRKMLGSYLRIFNAPARVANWMMYATLDGLPLTATPEAVQAITRRAATHRLRALASAPRAWSVLDPR